MIKQKRFEKILDIMNGRQAVSIEDLCLLLDVSKATIRRDLIYLDGQKLLKRTHGGAVSLVKPATKDVPISLRNGLYKPEKERIAKAALRLIEDGMTVYIGTGSTMRTLAAHLEAFTHLTVLTNDIGVAGDIAQRTTNGLIVSGGRLEPSTATLTGPFAESTLRDLHVDIAFLSADAVLPEGFLDVNMEEVAIKRMMIRNAQKSVMLCDQSKFGSDGFMTICPLSRIHLTITDGLDPEQERLLADTDMRLETA